MYALLIEIVTYYERVIYIQCSNVHFITWPEYLTLSLPSSYFYWDVLQLQILRCGILWI